VPRHKSSPTVFRDPITFSFALALALAACFPPHSPPQTRYVNSFLCVILCRPKLLEAWTKDMTASSRLLLPRARCRSLGHLYLLPTIRTNRFLLFLPLTSSLTQRVSPSLNIPSLTILQYCTRLNSHYTHSTSIATNHMRKLFPPQHINKTHPLNINLTTTLHLSRRLSLHTQLQVSQDLTEHRGYVYNDDCDRKYNLLQDCRHARAVERTRQNVTSRSPLARIVATSI
jgi:hypothetical protein